MIVATCIVLYSLREKVIVFQNSESMLFVV